MILTKQLHITAFYNKYKHITLYIIRYKLYDLRLQEHTEGSDKNIKKD